ncbi:MAG: hypothetical protein ACOYVK_15850 [Bacillota bacterium]
MQWGKQLGQSLRFVYGYLKGFIALAVLYVVVACTVIFFDPEAFSFYVIQYVKTSEYNKLKITWMGHLFMGLMGIYELIKCKNERKKRKRRNMDE